MAQAAGVSDAFKQYRFTADEFELLGRVGVFHEDDRVELIDGLIVEMSPMGSRHAACVDRLTQILVRLLAGKAVVRVQGPIRLGAHSEPQPDLTVLKLRDDFYSSRHPGPNDVLLVVEVMETSTDYDRKLKLPLYATACVPEVWLVDLAAEQVELLDQPAGGVYQRARSFKRGEQIESESVQGLKVPVEEVLG